MLINEFSVMSSSIKSLSDLITCTAPVILKSLQDHQSTSFLTSTSSFNCAPLFAGLHNNVLSRMLKASVIPMLDISPCYSQSV